jgi:uncharacterized protein (DUF885 family)
MSGPAAGIAVGLTGCGLGRPDPAPSLDTLLASQGEQLLREFPELATSMGMDAGPRSELKHRLDDRSIEGLARAAENCSARAAALQAVTGLSGSDLVNRDSALYANQLGAEAARFAFGDNSLKSIIDETVTPYGVSQMTGAVSTIPDFLDSQHKIEAAEDADAYLDRLAALPLYLDQETERVRRDAAGKVVPPDFILRPAIDQVAEFRRTAPADSPLVASLAARIWNLPRREERMKRAAALVEREIYPALDRQIAALSANQARTDGAAGLWRLPEGEAYYAWTLRIGTTTDLGAEAMHAIGLDQVATITDRMDRLLKQAGMSQGSVADRMAGLARDPANQFSDDDAGRAELLAYLNDRIAFARAHMGALSALPLKAEVVVKRVPVEIELGQPLGYMVSGPGDGSRPSIYYINLHDISLWPRFALPSLTYHETIPGHAWQGAAVAERGSLPLFNQLIGFNGYFEGWALYAEQLADEAGFYQRDPLGRLGYLQMQLLRACRLVADTGLHAKRWTRAAAIDWLKRHTGYPQAAVAHEVDRYCVAPGQACGYKIGQIELLRMRDKAKRALGDRFTLPRFDDAVLSAGAVPLTVLDRVVDDFIGRNG